MFASRIALTVLLPIASVVPAAAAADAAGGLTINLASYSFTPNPIQLAAGKLVTLTIVNQSGKGHDFTAKEFFAASAITKGAAPDGKVELAAHETKSITLTPRAGSYLVHCSHFLHASMGMKAEIVVR
jgi:plastocyanin